MPKTSKTQETPFGSNVAVLVENIVLREKAKKRHHSEVLGMHTVIIIYILLMAEILHQLRLVVYPTIYKVLAPSKRWLALGFLNHQTVYECVHGTQHVLSR